MSRCDTIFKEVATQIVEEAKASLSLEQSKTQEINNELKESSKLLIHDNPKCEEIYKEEMTSYIEKFMREHPSFQFQSTKKYKVTTD
jgi:hypothetical protein